MPLSDNEYLEILQSLRQTMREAGLGSVDERILSDLRGSEGPFYDLTIYLKLLISEFSLGSDEQLRNVLRRVRRSVKTESGDPVQGFRVQLSPEESRRYETEFVDFAPPPQLEQIIAELRSILEELRSDWDRPFDRGDEQGASR